MNPWWWHAACRGMPKDWFFGHEERERKPIPREAILACRRCPVAQECFEDALRSGDSGFRAGTTQRDRRSMKRHEGRVAFLD